jgi:hypothetical protein
MRSISVTAGRAVLVLVLLSATRIWAAEGIAHVYCPTPSDDLTLHPVVLEDLDGSGYLRGGVVDVTNPMTSRACSEALDFTFSPEDPGPLRIHFAEAMAYHYATAFHNYVVDLGFSAIGTVVPVVVFNAEPFGMLWSPVWTGYDATTGALSLAATVDGENSDAMDGTLVVHEFAHVVSHHLRGGTPGAFVGTETSLTEQGRALAEAVADYLAASYFSTPQMGKWSATIWQERPFLRNVDNCRTWPADFQAGYPYKVSLILSGALWDLRCAVGSAIADTLALQMMAAVPDSNPSTPELNTTFLDALAALLAADANLFGGAHESAICQAFAVRGLGEYDLTTPYPTILLPGDGYDGMEVYTAAGAPGLAVTFDDVVTKLDDLPYTKDESPRTISDAKTTVDWLILLDAAGREIGRYTGRQLQGQTIVVPGDTVQFHLVTDAARASFGYRVTDITNDLRDRELVFAGSGGDLRMLEAAGQDLGCGADAWGPDNYVIGTLTVGDASGPAHVRLQDAFDNQPGDDHEALYANALAIGAESVLELNGLNAYVGGGLTILGTLDVAGSRVVIDYEPGQSPLVQVAAWIISGCNGGAWDGPGIISSAAVADPDGILGVGVLDNADPVFGGLTEWFGLPVDETAILILATLNGDCNLDGLVDAGDYDVIDNTFVFGLAPGQSYGWWSGDLNGDGQVNSDDYDLIDNAFVFGGGVVGGPPGSAPEPATLALLLAGVAAGLLRCRHRALRW